MSVKAVEMVRNIRVCSGRPANHLAGEARSAVGI